MFYDCLEINTLEQYLPRLKSVSGQWGVDPSFIQKLVIDYFLSMERQRELYSYVQSPDEVEGYLLQLAIMALNRDQPLLDPEKAYILSLPLKEGITRKEVLAKFDDYYTCN